MPKMGSHRMSTGRSSGAPIAQPLMVPEMRSCGALIFGDDNDFSERADYARYRSTPLSFLHSRIANSAEPDVEKHRKPSTTHPRGRTGTTGE